MQVKVIYLNLSEIKRLITDLDKNIFIHLSLLSAQFVVIPLYK